MGIPIPAEDDHLMEEEPNPAQNMENDMPDIIPSDSADNQPVDMDTEIQLNAIMGATSRGPRPRTCG